MLPHVHKTPQPSLWWATLCYLRVFACASPMSVSLWVLGCKTTGEVTDDEHESRQRFSVFNLFFFKNDQVVLQCLWPQTPRRKFSFIHFVDLSESGFELQCWGWLLHSNSSALSVNINHSNEKRAMCEYPHSLYVSELAAAGWLHILPDQTAQATMDSAWMKNSSVPFTYSSRRKIFLQGRPPEMRHSHVRRPAATLPTRFSIKQANNTIPTPINKWSFLNKVLYTNLSLWGHSSHFNGNLHWPELFLSLSPLNPSFTLCRNKVGGCRASGVFTSSSCHHQVWIKNSTFHDLLGYHCSPHTSPMQTSRLKLFSLVASLLLRTGCSLQFKLEYCSLPDALVPVNTVLLLVSSWWD